VTGHHACSFCPLKPTQAGREDDNLIPSRAVAASNLVLREQTDDRPADLAYHGIRVRWHGLAVDSAECAHIQGNGGYQTLCGIAVHFHLINHAYDMAGGGLVLREVSRRLVEELRAVDVVGRWGGEELIVVAGGRA
jgi:Diguanylate cyclase, GGDEF domain